MNLIETERLTLRQLTLKDAPFIFRLVNEPSWLDNIGDKHIHSIKDAENYIEHGPLKSYRENGFGLYLIELKLAIDLRMQASSDQTKPTPIGLCGLVKRDELDDPDIGYALVPDYWGTGFASEAAKAIFDYSSISLRIKRVVGITSMDNKSSIRVLTKIGLKFDKLIDLPGYDQQSCLFVPAVK